jgi:DNA repair exonuclease SbcCD ATPase subunit
VDESFVESPETSIADLGSGLPVPAWPFTRHAAIKELEAKVAELAKEACELCATALASELKIEALQRELQAKQARVEALEKEVEERQQRVEALEGPLQGQIEKLGPLTEAKPGEAGRRPFWTGRLFKP